MTISNPEHPGWLEISIHIHPISHEALSAFLFDLGCEGIVSGEYPDHNLKAFLLFREDSLDIRNKDPRQLFHPDSQSHSWGDPQSFLPIWPRS